MQNMSVWQMSGNYMHMYELEAAVLASAFIAASQFCLGLYHLVCRTGYFIFNSVD